MENYPKEFTDYLCERFGLEWLDYANDECYNEWAAAKAAGTLSEMENNWC